MIALSSGAPLPKYYSATTTLTYPTNPFMKSFLFISCHFPKKWDDCFFFYLSVKIRKRKSKKENFKNNPHSWEKKMFISFFPTIILAAPMLFYFPYFYNLYFRLRVKSHIMHNTHYIPTKDEKSQHWFFNF